MHTLFGHYRHPASRESGAVWCGVVLWDSLLENSWKFLISVGNLRRASKLRAKKLIGSRIITMEFDNKSF